MTGQKRTTWPLILVLLATSLGACTGQHSTTSRPETGPMPSTAVGIADFKTVAGVWEGLLLGMSGPQTPRDWVMMRIGEDGSYEFASFREVGVFQGSGALQLSDGRLLLEGPRGGRASFTLYAENGHRMLRADAVANDGRRLTADLTPKR
jgi:hypothetical protein